MRSSINMEARFAPIYWEPIPDVGERVVAMLAVEPVSDEGEMVPEAHIILSPERLRGMFGSAWRSVQGVLEETAALVSQSMQIGHELEDIPLPFQGFSVGKVRTAEGRSVRQLLEAAVRTTSAFGSTDMIFSPMASSIRRETHATALFLRKVRQGFADGNPELRARFRKRLTATEGRLDLTVDYAHSKWLVQVSSLPSSRLQATLIQREVQSKFFELELACKEVGGAYAKPVLLVNAAALTTPLDDGSVQIARAMQERISGLANAISAQVIDVRTRDEGVRALESLT
ncbi:hypothetical protein [Bordetella bronchiseptica]|uniref:hypothetical protein n=1 Tax=Bordetella bronchiseptica TaxID=518 RepID=UPI0012680C59|nr:hypothetical protein [Bordetella bronchiseptica]